MSHSLRLELMRGELLVLQLVQAGKVLALRGGHWLTVDGRDVCLNEGESAMLPAGKILLEGNGLLQLTNPQDAAKPSRSLQLRRLHV